MLSKSVDPLSAPRRPWTLSRRLLVWFAAASFVLVFAATAILYLGLAREFQGRDEDHLLGRVHLVRAILQHTDNMIPELRWEVQMEQAESEDRDIFLRVYNRRGTLFLETAGMAALLPPAAFPPPGPTPADESRSVRQVTPTGRVFRLMTAQAPGASRGDPWIIQAALDLHAEDTVLSRYRNLLIAVLGASACASFWIAFSITHRGLRPLAQIVETTRRISTSTLSSERVRLSDLPADLASLAGHFNDMLDRLEEAFSRLSRFSADIAHELRTPLSNLRGEAEVALRRVRSADEYREVLASSLEEYDHLAAIIESLLFIALAERLEVAANREPIDVAAELRAVAEFYEPIAAEKQIALHLDATDELWSLLDRVLFRRAVSTLVANAIAYTPAGGSISISAALRDSALYIEVADSGIGIAPEHLPHLFDRFYRVQHTSGSQPGSCGLGLSIVKTIMIRHGGTVEILSHPGAGTRAFLTFPQPGSDGAVPSASGYLPPESTVLAGITKT